MRHVLAWTMFAATLAAGVATTAAPEQTTARPGEMSKAEVWIRNRGDEAVPVDLRTAHIDPPLRVIVANGEPAVEMIAKPIPVRLPRVIWDYRTVTIAAGDDPAAALNRLGADGWETTGIAWPGSSHTLLLLKRAR